GQALLGAVVLLLAARQVAELRAARQPAELLHAGGVVGEAARLAAVERHHVELRRLLLGPDREEREVAAVGAEARRGVPVLRARELDAAPRGPRPAVLPGAARGSPLGQGEEVDAAAVARRGVALAPHHRGDDAGGRAAGGRHLRIGDEPEPVEVLRLHLARHARLLSPQRPRARGPWRSRTAGCRPPPTRSASRSCPSWGSS